MAQPSAASTNGSGPGLDGLTPLHLAVLHGSYVNVRSIVNDGKYGVNAQTATKTTPLMLAALFGRSEIFLYLLRKNASPENRDSHGNTPLNYAEPSSAFIQNPLRQCKDVSTKSPDTSMRRDIYVMLKAIRAIRHKSKKAYKKGRADARAEAHSQPQTQAPVIMDQVGHNQPFNDPARRAEFLPSLDGKHLEFVEGRCTAAIKPPLGRKCIGLICAAGENDTHVFAISGWGTARDKNVATENVLNNLEYTRLVMSLAALVRFELRGNERLDFRFPGTASEQEGAFWACHAEKQLAVFVLRKALSYVSCSGALTEYNLTLLKDQLDKLPPELRKTVIHLNHEVACRDCVRFLNTMTQKTGLVFQIEFHKWYIERKRSKMQFAQDESSIPVSGAAKPSDSDDCAELLDDELGLFDSPDTTHADLPCDSVEQGGDVTMSQSTPVTPVMPKSCRPRVERQWSLGLAYRKGSAVSEEPPKKTFRYTVPIVTPPAKKTQVLPTPESQARFAEFLHVTASPSPATVSPAFGPASQADSMSISLSQEFEVEEILSSMHEDGVELFLVKWKGYPHDCNTWEPESNLMNATDAINKFREELRAVQSQVQDMYFQYSGEYNP